MVDSEGGAPGIVALGVIKEQTSGEDRVALVPEDIAKLSEAGVATFFERGAGQAAFLDDARYEAVGAKLVATSAEVIGNVDILMVVRPPGFEDLAGLKSGSAIVGFLDPFRNGDMFEALSTRGVTAFAVERIPRITRAQSMDALSSMSTIAGYRAVLLAAEASKRMFPMLITAAGTQPPCRVLVLGAGVAGLQALATAKRLGAITSGFDTRPEVREQVQSVGATFVAMAEELQVAGTAGGYAQEVGADFLRREQDSIRPHITASDVVITTALIPGRPAPILITGEMARGMKPGSVIVDLASEAGGNCELTVPGQHVVDGGVIILGPLNLPGQVATQASQMYSRNLANFVRLLVKDGRISINMEDEIIREACVTKRAAAVEA